jgi:hypothetical protein
LPSTEPVAETLAAAAAEVEDAALEDAGELAKLLRPIGDPLHAVRDAQSNRKTFSLISATCPPENSQ